MASKSVDFGLSCLGLPSNPVLRRVWNVPLQPRPGQAKERGWGAFQLVLWPGASGWPFLSAWVSWGGLLLRTQWARRWLEVSASCEGWQSPGWRPAPKAHTEGPRSGGRVAQGREELGLGEQDFLASWAQPLRAWPHKAPFVEGPAPGQTQVSEQ